MYLNAWKENHAKSCAARQSAEHALLKVLTQRVNLAESLLTADLHMFQLRAKELESFRSSEVTPALRTAAEALNALEGAIREEDQSFRAQLAHRADAFVRSSKRLRENIQVESFENRQKQFLDDLNA